MNEHQEARRAAWIASSSALIVILIFIAAALAVKTQVERNATFQRNLRVAQLDRSRLLRLQIDEETGLRGYIATRAPVFLTPYRTGLARFGRLAVVLSHEVAEFGLNNDAVNQEVRTNDFWVRDVAEPSIANSREGLSLTLQLRGKQLVDHFRSLDVKLNEEINTVADAGDARTHSLVTLILAAAIAGGVMVAILVTIFVFARSRLAAEVAIEHRAYLEEKRIADALQEAFLQKTLPEVARADLRAVYVPAGYERKVGGDWYDAFELSEDRILFSVGDVAGHGVEAAVVMSRVRQAILSVGLEERDPAKVLDRANEILLLQDATIVTAICGTIDLVHGILTFANAGHPAAILVRSGDRIEMLGSSGPPLGATDRPAYRAISTPAEPGTMLVLYTDGLIEYSRDWEAGEKRLLETILRVSRAAPNDPAAAIMEEIFHGEPPFDDVAILTIAFREPTGSPALSPRAASASARPLLDRSVCPILESTTA